MRGDLHGIGVGRGAASGTVRRMTTAGTGEPMVLDAAIEAVGRDLDDVAARTGSTAVAAQAAMVRDPGLRAEVDAGVVAGLAPQEALDAAIAGYVDRLAALGGAFADRTAEVADIGHRIRARLLGTAAAGLPDDAGPHVLFADDLAVADAVRLDPARTLAVVLRAGGPTAHAAIVLRSRGIPVVLRVAAELADGEWVRVDAATGTVSFDPAAPAPAPVAPSPVAPGRLADGTPIALFANVGSAAEADAAVVAGAEGIGLLRTELMFMGRSDVPGLQEQRDTYAEILCRFPGRPVVARTFDDAPDKPLGFTPDRVIQLEALVAAARDTGAELRVMVPMIGSAAQADTFAAQARAAGVDMVGAMAEVPSLADDADALTGAVDFLSIGTNDLTALVLGRDRGRDALDAWDPRVLRLVRAFCATGLPVGVCGEAAADPGYAIVLVGLGASSLSVAPEALAGVRAALAGVDLEEARARAAAAVTI